MSREAVAMFLGLIVGTVIGLGAGYVLWLRPRLTSAKALRRAVSCGAMSVNEERALRRRGPGQPDPNPRGGSL